MFVPEQPAERADTYPAAPPDRVFTGHPVKLTIGDGASAGSRASTFEGPVDLLLFLIARDEIDIFDIPIEHITNEYLQYLGQLESLNIDVCGEFLVMAAQLLEIKSRMLLPQQERPQQEEEEAGDPRAELVSRLLEYRRYKRVAEELRARAEIQRFVFSRRTLTNGEGNGNGNGDSQPVLELSDVSAFDLWAAFQNVLSRVKEPAQGELVRARFTVAQKMAAVASRLKWSKEEGIRFEELFDEAVTRLELVVTFLALLELIRLRRVRVAQERNFGEIRVYPYRTDSQ
ncbi:MAG: segregation/condensation protein A [Armatimonadetes bacterium]|nr:segregation/condensation protein A [Armatimonadota bacterium]